MGSTISVENHLQICRNPCYSNARKAIEHFVQVTNNDSSCALFALDGGKLSLKNTHDLLAAFDGALAPAMTDADEAMFATVVKGVLDGKLTSLEAVDGATLPWHARIGHHAELVEMAHDRAWTPLELLGELWTAAMPCM